MKISAYIITFNEADKILDCINSVLWADEIIVADSFSTDGTTEIAQSMDVKLVQIPFDGFGELRNKAISYCSGEWIFSLDSDESCTEDVRDEILDIVKSEKSDLYRVPKRNFFMGKWIKFSGWYPNFRQPQLFRNGKMRYDLDPVHEGYINNSNKPIGVLKNAIWQVPFKDMEQLIHKANRYSSLGVIKLEKKGIKGGIFRAFFHGSWSFIKHYILKLGFLDGGPGFVIALSNFEGTFYRYLKLLESQKNWEPPIVKPINRK